MQLYKININRYRVGSGVLMSDYIYSAGLNMICAVALKSDYELAGTWPADAVALTSEQAREFMGDAPEGKILAAGDTGLPVWQALPPLTADELSAKARQHRDSLLGIAEDTISIWQTKLLLGRISDEDKARLNRWLDFIDAVQAADLSDPTDVRWPPVPE